MAGSLDAGTNDNVKNNAPKCWSVCKKGGFNDSASAGILGNIYAESMFNANAKETPSSSSGYGLVQWTPGTNVYAQGAQCGVSRSECETVEGQMKIVINADKTGQWQTGVASGADTTPLGYPATPHLTVGQYKSASGWKQACVDWENHFERGLVGPTLRIELRIHAAEYFYDKFKGTGGDDSDDDSQGTINVMMIDNYVKRRR